MDFGLLLGLSHDYSTGEVHGDKHWPIRTKKNNRWKTLKALGEGDELVELNVSCCVARPVAAVVAPKLAEIPGAGVVSEHIVSAAPL